MVGARLLRHADGRSLWGNNLFQIAVTESLARKYDTVAQFTPWDYNGVLAAEPDHHFVPEEFPHIWTELHFHYAEIPYDPGTELQGYFQSEKYFDPLLVRELFRPSLLILIDIISSVGQILKHRPVSVHVRRGDYLQLQDKHPVCSMDYYLEAMKRFDKRTFIICSDDPEWCKGSFTQEVLADSGIEGTVVVMGGGKDFMDFYLMTMCNDHIIANSSFSWWAAYLGINLHRKVIYPTRWFGEAYSQHDIKDLIPEWWEGI